MVVSGLRSPIQAQKAFVDLLDSLIVDVATEVHRGARLGLDHRLDYDENPEAQLSAHARATVSEMDSWVSDISGKNATDVFGSSHPAVANETFDCMNCRRPIVAGRFAPHLEKCMGKVQGRKSRVKPHCSSGSMQQRRARPSSLLPAPIHMGSTSNGATNQLRGHSPASMTDVDTGSSVDANNWYPERSPSDDRSFSSDRLPVKSRTKNLKSNRVTGVLNQRALTSAVGRLYGGEDQVSPALSNPQISNTGPVSQLSLPNGVQSPTTSARYSNGYLSTMKQKRHPEKKKDLEQVLAGSQQRFGGIPVVGLAANVAQNGSDGRSQDASEESYKDHIRHTIKRVSTSDVS